MSCTHPPMQMKDAAGNTYPTRAYGEAIWMTENLRTTQDRDGNSVSFFAPDGNPNHTAVYGLLYDYETALKVCPTGWRLPSNEDWDQLFSHVKDSTAAHYKDMGQWEGESTTNQTGFAVRPAGYGNEGEFDNFFQSKAIFWSRTDTSEHIWTYLFEKDSTRVRTAQQHSTYAFSVRCIKN